LSRLEFDRPFFQDVAAMQRTPLYEAHLRLGAKMVDFGGWAMPVAYTGGASGGIIDEHRATRGAVGVFDVCHMGEIHFRGARAGEAVQRLVTNDVGRLTDGRALYTVACRPSGGIVDDLIVYRISDHHYLTVVNAANLEKDRAWFIEQASALCDVIDASAETGLIAFQGPAAGRALQPLTRTPLDAVPGFGFVASCEIAGIGASLARTGYTGEDGFELFTAAAAAETLFSAILDAGAPTGMMPCGLGARDTLRMEAGLPLYGHELDRATSPLEAGLDTFVKVGREFVGAAALAAQQRDGLKRRLVGIRTEDGRSVARQGYKLFVGEREVGVMTSGTFAPSFDRPLGMAYLATAAGAPEQVEVEIRNRRVAAAVTGRPFYRRGKPSTA
jgi:aminomethyltransferase